MCSPDLKHMAWQEIAIGTTVTTRKSQNWDAQKPLNQRTSYVQGASGEQGRW